MSFPGSSQTSLATIWENVQGQAGRIKDRSAALVSASSITRRQVLEHQNYLLDARATLEALTAAPGLQAYAQNEVNTPGLNLATEYTNMRNTLDAVVAWGVSNFPNTTGELRVYMFVSSRVTDINLTAPELSAYKAQLSTLAGTIN